MSPLRSIVDSDYLTYLYNRKAAILKNYGTDLFCTNCWMANELDAVACVHCQCEVVKREEALPRIDQLISSVLEDGVRRPDGLVIQWAKPEPKKRFNYDVEKVKRPDPYKHDVKPISKKYESSRDQEGGIEIIISYMDEPNREPLKTVIHDRRLARRYLRQMGLSVNMAEKRADPERKMESWLLYIRK